MVGQFRSSTWDPVLIVSQMVAMQCVFYVGFGACIAVSDYVIGTHRSMDQMFGYQLLHFRDLQGVLLILASFINALLGGLALWYVVQRTKQCWDFAATVYVVHALLCWTLTGAFPASVSWWLDAAVCGTAMTVLGEYLCLRTELTAIPLSGGGSRVDL